MKRPVVLLDVDGVLGDFVSAYLDAVRSVTGRSYELQDVKGWEVKEWIHLDSDEEKLVDERVRRPDFCTGMRVFDGARVGVELVKDVAEIYALTAPFHGSKHWVNERFCWLEKHFSIPSDHVIFASSKAKVRVHGDLFVDDRVSTLKSWQRHWPGGRAVRWETPHNANDAWAGASTTDWRVIRALAEEV